MHQPSDIDLLPLLCAGRGLQPIRIKLSQNTVDLSQLHFNV